MRLPDPGNTCYFCFAIVRLPLQFRRQDKNTVAVFTAAPDRRLNLMNKAFVKETDEDDEPEHGLPALPAGFKNYITPAGHQRLKDELLFLIDKDRPEVVKIASCCRRRTECRVRGRVARCVPGPLSACAGWRSFQRKQCALPGSKPPRRSLRRSHRQNRH